MFSKELGDGDSGVAVFACKLEGVVVCRAANAAAHVVEENEWKRLIDLLRCQGGREAERRDVEAVLTRIAALVLVVPGE